MAGKERNLLKQFGPHAAPETTFKAAEISAGLDLPLYAFNHRVKVGAFPPPDFVQPSLRAWKLKTIRNHNPELAKRLVRHG